MDNHYPWTNNTRTQQPFQLPTDQISLNHQEPASNHNDPIEFSHEHPQHPYMIMTRAASPVVFGQGHRRPLTMGNPAVLGNLISRIYTHYVCTDQQQ